MKSSAGLHLKTFVMIFLMILFGPLGNVSLAKGMKSVGGIAVRHPADLLRVAVQVFETPFIWIGISFLLMMFVAYLLVLSWADYSFVQPASSVSYGVVALLGHFVLKERVSATHWAGVCVVCLGVLVVGHTPPRTTEHN
ncbi:MAG: hypothetical protein WA192_08250 [Candidatus Acidiferrales bacterium]